jgi:YggT family protein
VVRETGVLVAAAQGGGRSLLYVLVDWSFGLINLALIVRVVGSWFGIGRWTTWMKPFYYLTEWFLAPLRRMLPTVGPLDISPLVAWLVLGWLIKPFVLGLL